MQREEGHVKTGRNWSKVAASQGTPSIEAKKGQEGHMPRAFRGSMALLTP